jgi:hypothetical protein
MKYSLQGVLIWLSLFCVLCLIVSGCLVNLESFERHIAFFRLLFFPPKPVPMP